MKALALFLCAAVAAAPTAGLAAADRPTIAVLDVKAVGKVDEAQVAGLSALIASEVASRTDMQVLSGADLRALIGFERQKQMLGCDDAACLAEIGGALGAQYIVASEASQVGKTWLLTLSLVETGTVRSVSRLTRRTQSDDDLVEEAISGVDELMRPLRAVTAPAATAGPAAKKREPSGKAAGWVSLVTGVLALGAGGFFLADSFALASDYKKGTDDSPVFTRDRADDIRSEGQLKSVLGYSGIGLGAVLLTIGILSVSGGDEPPADPRADLPGPGLGGLRASRGAP